MKKGPWVKLWRNVLGDEKIAFLMRRYGHETFTFWIGLLTHTDYGVLLEDEEVFADACQITEKRYSEIRGIFLKYGLVEEDEEKHLVIKNWDEYQISESTDRVRRFRDKQKQDETLPKRECNAFETTEGEGDREGEEEGERAREVNSQGQEEPKASAVAATPLAPIESVPPSGAMPTSVEACGRWYAKYGALTGRNILPSGRDLIRAQELMTRVGGDLSVIALAAETYFVKWKELWFARRGKENPVPDFSFASFCDHIGEILAISTGPFKALRTDFSTAEPPSPEELRQPTAEDLAAVEAAKRRLALSGAVGRKIVAELGTFGEPIRIPAVA